MFIGSEYEHHWKGSKSSIRSKCHRVIGIFAFSLFMMHVQGSVHNLRDCASMMLSEREGKECSTNKKGVSGWPFYWRFNWFED